MLKSDVGFSNLNHKLGTVYTKIDNFSGAKFQPVACLQIGWNLLQLHGPQNLLLTCTDSEIYKI